VGVPKFSRPRLSQLWGPITLRVNLQLRWVLKKSYRPHWELSKNMLHGTWTQGNQGDSWLLVVRNQIANLTPDPSFGPNLCFKCPNGSWELILDIYILRSFQWYKKLLNPLSFDPCNWSMKIWESTQTPIPQVEALLELWGFIPSHFPTLLEHAVWLSGFPLSPQPCKPLPWSQAQG
jgi:hypothetical protein